MTTTQLPCTVGEKPDNGRCTVTGRFLSGNPGGPGRPHHARMHEWRESLSRAVTGEDIARIMQTMVRLAIAGDVAAAKEVMDRCVGRALQGHLVVTDDASDVTRDPRSMIKELRAALGVPDDDDQAGQVASRAEIIAEQDAIVVIDAKTADHIPVP